MFVKRHLPMQGSNHGVFYISQFLDGIVLYGLMYHILQ